MSAETADDTGRDTQKVLFIFPGQGSQYSGIGSDLHERFAVARDVYARASETLGFDVAELSFRGSDRELTLTRNTQPVLLTHHLACLAVFRELSGGKVAPYACAGHSLGEYSALVAADRLDIDDALRLVKHRGELMAGYGSGEMLALPLPLADAAPLAERHFCAVAGCNLPEQTVVGGRSDDLARLEQRFAEDYPRKRAVRLKTEGAFHTYYMVTAATCFREALEPVTVTAGRARVLCNYTGSYHDEDPDSVRTRLFLQLFHPVLWLDNLGTALDDGVDDVVEFGGGIGDGAGPAGKRPNLAAMVKKVQRGRDRQAGYHAAINIATLETAAAAFG